MQAWTVSSGPCTAGTWRRSTAGTSATWWRPRASRRSSFSPPRASPLAAAQARPLARLSGCPRVGPVTWTAWPSIQSPACTCSNCQRTAWTRASTRSCATRASRGRRASRPRPCPSAMPRQAPRPGAHGRIPPSSRWPTAWTRTAPRPAPTQVFRPRVPRPSSPGAAQPSSSSPTRPTASLRPRCARGWPLCTTSYRLSRATSTAPPPAPSMAASWPRPLPPCPTPTRPRGAATRTASCARCAGATSRQPSSARAARCWTQRRWAGTRAAWTSCSSTSSCAARRRTRTPRGRPCPIPRSKASRPCTCASHRGSAP
mmetsp:Transcript_2925/g.8477  ORF Transcript_2925/g.8477 Transcript_2925/m.8477 type:complete len:315 (+) Transcript_2925:1808-2752(+)